MFLLYNLLLTLGAPIWVPWMLWRSWRRGGDIDWKQRQGTYPLPPRGDRRRVWIHAVSVGEVMAALPILRELRQELPTYEIVLSVTTTSGHQTAAEKATGLYDYLVYFPIDVARFQLSAMQRVRPDVVAIMETELWMNFLWAAKTFDARTLLINGRISDRSFPRAKRLGFFYSALLREVDRCLMQSAQDAERIKSLGARSVEVLGNCKFDQAAEGLSADPKMWRKELGLAPDRPVIVVGSIRAEEFEFLARAIANYRHPQWIVAPRHLERTADLVAKLEDAEFTGGAPCASIAFRSKKQAGDVIVLDSYGELSEVYSVADIAVVGGGFANLGGQNILQPLAHGKPTLFGSHMQNFRDVAAMAVSAGAGFVCGTPNELNATLERLIKDPAARTAAADAARKLVAENVGASRRYALAISHEVTAGAAR